MQIPQTIISITQTNLYDAKNQALQPSDAIYCYICLQSSWSPENGILVSVHLYFSPSYEPFSSIALLDNCGAIFTYAYHNLQKTVDLKGA